MEVIKITPRGYCHGVVEAMRILDKTIAQNPDEPITMLGHLVHNKHITDEFAQRGVHIIESTDRLSALESIPEGIVVFTAHGVSPMVKAVAQAKGLRTVDATCSDVTVTHDLIRRLSRDGYTIIYIGRKGHPEPEGAIGEAPNSVILIENLAEVENLELDTPKLAVTTQTTLSVWDTQAIVDRLQAKFPQIEVYNEICRATQDRQESAVKIARTCDLVIVVGDSSSSNTQKLVQVVTELAQCQAHLVDTAQDLRPEWFKNIQRVGVTSGASTPSHLTREVIATLENYANTNFVAAAA